MEHYTVPFRECKVLGEHYTVPLREGMWGIGEKLSSAIERENVGYWWNIIQCHCERECKALVEH